jgi:hypothetical protein
VIGVKSAATLSAGVVLLVVCAWAGAIAPARLAALEAPVRAGVGAFAVLGGSVVYALFALGERSQSAFRIGTGPAPWDDEPPLLSGRAWRLTLGEGGPEAFELPAAAQRALCMALALLAALVCVDGRTLLRLRAAHQAPRIACGPPPPAPAPSGSAACELVRRAFALGYTKSLGDCAPPPAPAVPPACELRQDDEPAAHYAWRKLREFWARARGASLERLRPSWHAPARRELEELLEAQRQVLASAPHALVELWTDLPDPGAAFGAPRCEERYRLLPPAPAATAAPGQALEHALAQLLVDSRYAAPSISCRDVHVHWGAPPDACARLVADPVAALAQVGALASVRALLARHRLAAQRGGEPGAADRSLRLACYLETGPARRRTLPLRLDGVELIADELSSPTPGAGPVGGLSRTRSIASVLARSFRYGALLSEAGLAQRAPSEEAITGEDLRLSRLFGLDALDLYLEPGWVTTRPDVLEVYPYDRHLRNFVQLFRRELARTWGRL